MEQQGVMSTYQLTAHNHSGVGQGGLVDPSVINHDALLNFVLAEHLSLSNTIVNVLTDHNKVAHDALLINAGQVDGIEGAEILQRDGSVPLTVNWGAGNARVILLGAVKSNLGGIVCLGELAANLRVVYDADEVAKFLGVSNAICGLKISKAIIGAFELNSLIANNKIASASNADDSDLVDGIHIPNTIANVLTNHTKAVHDALKIESGYLGAATDLTIATGEITVTGCHHKVDTEGGAGADDLVTINGGVDGQILAIQSKNNARDVTVKHGTGNVYMLAAADFVLSLVTKRIIFFHNNGEWFEISNWNL